jgi:2-aminoadipate transaminase
MQPADAHRARERTAIATRHRDVLALHRRAAARDDVIALAGGVPADALLPSAAIAAALAEAAAMGPDAMQYGWPEGDATVRAWIAERLRARGAAISADDVVVTAGAQQALSLCTAVIAPRTIAVDGPTYPAALVAFERVADVVERGPADVRYVIAGANNPDGVDRLTPVRAELIAGAAPIIVDEAYVELRFDGRVDRPLIADARDRAWHVGTVSKTVCPGLRIGWLVPPPDRRDAVLEAKHAADLQTGSLAQAAFARLISAVDLDAVAERARNLYAARADRLTRALRRRAPGWRFADPDGGFSVWVETDEDGDDVELLARAIAAGVSFDPGRLFRPDHAAVPIAFRLSFSHAAVASIDEGVRRLVDAFRIRSQAPRAAHAPRPWPMR